MASKAVLTILYKNIKILWFCLVDGVELMMPWDDNRELLATPSPEPVSCSINHVRWADSLLACSSNNDVDLVFTPL